MAADSVAESDAMEIQILEAKNLPRIVSILSQRPFFIRASHALVTRQTKSLRPEGGSITWNERLTGFTIDDSSQFLLQVYARRNMHEPILVGSHSIPPEKVQARLNENFSVIVHYADGRAKGTPMELKIQLSAKANASSSSTGHDLVPGSSSVSAAEDALKDMQNASGTASAIVTSADLVATMATTIQTQYDLWEPLLSKIGAVLAIVNEIAEIHPYANIAWTILSAIPKAITGQMERDQSVRGLLEVLKDAFDTLHDAEDLEARCHDQQQANIIARILQQTGECGHFIQSYAKDANFWKRLARNVVTSKADNLVTKYTDVLRELRQAFLDRTTVTTKVCVLQLADDLEDVAQQLAEIDADAILRDLPYGEGAAYNPAKGCFIGTRTLFLDELSNWVHNPDSPRMLVLFGQAGSGKSSIAHEIARRLDEMDRLTSSFTFDRSFPRPPHLPITTLARDLSDRNPSFKRALVKAIRGDTSLRLGNRDCRSLFSQLLLEQLKTLHSLGPLFIVIDGLDECDEESREGLVLALSTGVHELPSDFRILITARPESDLEAAFASNGEVRVLRMDDEALSADTEHDILAYVRSRVSSRISDKQCIQLGRSAGRLFQWAAVACDFIAKPPRGLTAARAFDILVHKPHNKVQQKLDELYDTVLQALFPNFEEYEEVPIQFRFFMSMILASVEPLCQDALVALGQLVPDPPSEDLSEILPCIVEGMGSLLSNVSATTTSLPIVPLHASFRDFLTSKERSKMFFVDLIDANRTLAHACLGLLLRDLRFNLCSLETSHFYNMHIPDPGDRIREYIPSYLSYACRYWDDHLEHVPFEAELLDRIDSLFRSKLLFWLEALSLIGSMNAATPALTIVRDWLAAAPAQGRRPVSEGLNDLANEASRFVRYFAMPIAQSAAHIYLSAIPFAPSSSPIYSLYRPRLPRTISIGNGCLLHWPVLQMQIPAHRKTVTSIAFSHDGYFIASASYDWNISVWDAETGEQVLGPLIGHSNPIMSIAFSPDDRRIISGSEDDSFRVWDATTGDLIFTSFYGHEKGIEGVSFMPDGNSILAYSRDRTVRVWNPSQDTSNVVSFKDRPNGLDNEEVTRLFSLGYYIVVATTRGTVEAWDASTGERVAGPFEGDGGLVYSMALSRDKRYIAAGTRNNAIHVWDLSTGQKLAGPLKGHTQVVYSLAFSPADSQVIASGSSDHTVRVWHFQTSTCIAGPFEAHSGPVRSIAFSPDGRRITSGSTDTTICVWDMQVSEPEPEKALSGHADDIKAIAYSPDGKRFVSGSRDLTLRVWDLTSSTAECTMPPLNGHTEVIQTVAYSPDGRLIASGSDDCTVRVWNAATGEAVGQPLTGHRQSVQSVVFSPNGLLIASGSSDETVHLWDVATGATAAFGPFEGHTWGVLTIAFSPDGRHLAAGSLDNAIRIWSVETGALVLGPIPAHESWVHSLVYSRDGTRIISASDDCTLCVWDVSSGNLVAGPFEGHNAEVVSVAVSPDGKHVASGSWDRSVCVWDMETGEIVAGPFNGHTGRVNAVTFAPDGRYLASCSVDRTIRIWDMECAAQPTEEAFTDHHELDKDGWVRDVSGDLLFWVPSIHRTTLARPSTARILNATETRLDFSRFVHGEEWATCYDTSVTSG